MEIVQLTKLTKLAQHTTSSSQPFGQSYFEYGQ